MKKRFSDTNIIEFLNQVATGTPLEKLCEANDFHKAEFDKWRQQFGNRYATSDRSRRPSFFAPYLSVSKLADELHLPSESIFYLASQGYVDIFALVDTRNAACVSVHKDFIAPHGLNLPTAVLALPNLQTVGISQADHWNVVGFFLGREDCMVFLRDGKLSQSLFPAALKKRFDHYQVEVPLPGYVPFDRHPDLDPEGWRFACYPKGTSFDLDRETGYPVPIHQTCRLASLYVLQEHIESLLDVIDSNALLDDLLVEPAKGASITTSHVIVDKPAYLSSKLTHLIETSERFWQRRPLDESSDYAKKREKVRKALSDPDFLDCFKMVKASTILLRTAERFIEPLYARSNMSDEGKLSGHAYLAPELLILLAAAKLFWSPPHVDFENPATHPKNEEIEAYFRVRNITGNDADYATTLIRPEQARFGGHKPFISLRDRNNPLLRKPTFSRYRSET